jgi:hypothetical protein
MSTSYYRIPKLPELFETVQKLQLEILNSPNDTEWFKSEFQKDTEVHLGSRSKGWRFTWNFHDGKHYTNKEELLEFIRNGRVFDEYDREIDPEEFIEMALSWEINGGLVYNREYCKNLLKSNLHAVMFSEDYDREIDGLIVSSSTDFN